MTSAGAMQIPLTGTATTPLLSPGWRGSSAVVLTAEKRTEIVP